MKYLPLVLIYIIFITGCSDSWSQKDKQLFISDCLDQYGTQTICSCILNCLESEYDNYETVLQKLPSPKVKKELNECLTGCQ
ncbi:hypothetical protein N9471_00050 [bacterium]|jgi:cell fate regulator YaaT (PSP1 superfamily)|nr:hypothetical protein [bacterium]|tara:strand:- start:248 stop:493 length:246 start_codon:yes stop_codon:yes gene_type:complete